MRLFRLLFLTCLFLVVYASQVGAEEKNSAKKNAAVGKQGGPVVEVKAPSFNFGTVSRGEVVKHDFQVFNKGDVPLEIEKVKPG